MDTFAATADELATAPLLGCLLREAAEPLGGGVHRTRAGGRLLRVASAHRPRRAQLLTDGQWRPLTHADLVKLVSDELSLLTGVSNDTLPAEMIDSRDALAAILTARAGAHPPADPWLRSEQSLLMGHPHHPAPKARGGGPAGTWLRYAPEAYARFPLTLLAVRADALAEEGDTSALDALAPDSAPDSTPVPPGYHLLPAHPWQLALLDQHPGIRAAFTDGRLLRLAARSEPAAPTSSVRTVHLAGADLFLKFSLDVRITNDIRRLWWHDLRRLRRTDTAVSAALAADPGADPAADTGAAWLSDRGYRAVAGLGEELAVVVREGFGTRLRPGATPLLAAALAEGFEGSPLAAAPDPAGWWTAYLRCLVPPVLRAFARHGVVLECHLQNCLLAVDAAGLPVQALFRDAEGVRTLAESGRAAGWERLVYCLLVNHLTEIAATLADRHPAHARSLWPTARRELRSWAEELDLPELHGLLKAPTVPGKANLLLRWTAADGAAARYVPVPNPLAAC
ncbi:IucA/IucC family protein [Streptomyces polyrhachis]|uniref:IucA/IucC family protein n=1 Tax=Streptomyces polyrhachis TaxID=1282885 RepID=A0ABW2GBQ0_9ACTN